MVGLPTAPTLSWARMSLFLRDLEANRLNRTAPTLYDRELGLYDRSEGSHYPCSDAHSSFCLVAIIIQACTYTTLKEARQIENH
jgi:hypothetical protein